MVDEKTYRTGAPFAPQQSRRKADQAVGIRDHFAENPVAPGNERHGCSSNGLGGRVGRNEDAQSVLGPKRCYTKVRNNDPLGRAISPAAGLLVRILGDDHMHTRHLEVDNIIERNTRFDHLVRLAVDVDISLPDDLALVIRQTLDIPAAEILGETAGRAQSFNQVAVNDAEHCQCHRADITGCQGEAGVLRVTKDVAVACKTDACRCIRYGKLKSLGGIKHCAIGKWQASAHGECEIASPGKARYAEFAVALHHLQPRRRLPGHEFLQHPRIIAVDLFFKGYANPRLLSLHIQLCLWGLTRVRWRKTGRPGQKDRHKISRDECFHS